MSRDAYVGLWNIAPDGSIMQIFPNEFEADHLFKAGKARVVPGKSRDGRSYEIEAVLTHKPERVWVMASSKPWDPVQSETAGPFTLFKTPEQQANLKSTLRGFRLKAGPRQDGLQVSEEVLLYQIVPPEK